MIKYKMKNKEFVLGTWCDIPSTSVANILAEAGLNFIIIDMEHGPMDFNLAQEMAMAAQCAGCDALIRVPENNESSILRALDCGADGIIVPHVESTQDVEKIIEYSKFAPVGQRGFNPFIRAGAYHNSGSDFFEKQNEKVLIGIILEGQGGLDNLEQIVSYPEVDVVYLGAYDLSIALGIPGDVGNAKVIRAMDTAIEKINKKGKAAGVMIHNESDLKVYMNKGVQFLVYEIDSAVMYSRFRHMKKELDDQKL